MDLWELLDWGVIEFEIWRTVELGSYMGLDSLGAMEPWSLGTWWFGVDVCVCELGSWGAGLWTLGVGELVALELWSRGAGELARW